MSFVKAERLLALAAMTAARHRGVTIADVTDRFAISKRTAQRMLRALEAQFPEATTTTDDLGHKRWLLSQSALKQLINITPEELAAFDLATESLKRAGALIEEQRLITLREKILAVVPKAVSVRLEADHESLLDAQGFLVSPGPKPRLNVEVEKVITHAVKAARALGITYQTRSGAPVLKRDVVPYGIVTGLRRYLVARTLDEDETRAPKLYAVENIEEVRVLKEPAARPIDFDLQKYCQRSFGVFQNDDEMSEVVLRFTPKAAARARQFEFHPTQTLEEREDGSVIVRFTAAGLLEMTWHLYTWGDQVEVLNPPVLREMVHPHRRADFASLP
jgi:predicted DNA-binding transcriptional regulator YafY